MKVEANWLYVDAFESAFAEDETTAEKLQPLRQAIELYRADFPEGLSVRQAFEFEEWVLSERERLRQMAIQALQRLSVAYTAREEYAAGIEYTNQLLALEPWQEEARRQLMTLLARSGQQSAALAQYEACRRILAEELGVEPLPETQALYHRLKTMREATPHNLPPQTTSFVGRQAELAQIANYLDRSDCRLLTLIGAGGIGKTRLALQAAGQALDVFADVELFVQEAHRVRPDFSLSAEWPAVVRLEARHHLAGALKIAYETDAVTRLTDVLYRIGDLLQRTGQSAAAVEYLTFVQYHSATDNRERREVGELLEKLTPGLPPEILAAAQARGRDRTLEETVTDVLDKLGVI